MVFPACQAKAVTFLRQMASCEPVETHISGVFVGAKDAWKLKKSVQLPYLDFTSVESRHKYLLRELELNQPAAPDIYREVLALDQTPAGGLVLRSEAESVAPVDWVLRMAPIPHDAFLDKVALHGLSPAMQDALADCVAHAHTTHVVQRRWDSAGALRGVADQATASARQAGLANTEIEVWRGAFQSALDSHTTWLQERVQAGFVRRCHGDLHLGNLCLWQGRPTPFDALEFDEAMATIDVGYDIAFLLMDLDQRVHRRVANRVMNRYMARTGDTALSRGLNLFMSLRAMIRADVSAASGDLAAGKRYLAASHDYLCPIAAGVIAIGGLPGTGKSTLARSIAPQFGRAPGAVIIRSDEVRKHLFSLAPEQPLPAAAYDQAVNQTVAEKIADAAYAVASGGHSVIVDATFIEPAQRRLIAQTAEQANVAFTGVWLTAPLAILEERISQRQADASDATVDVLHAAKAKDPGLIEWLCVDATDAATATSTVMQTIRTT